MADQIAYGDFTSLSVFRATSTSFVQWWGKWKEHLFNHPSKMYCFLLHPDFDGANSQHLVLYLWKSNFFILQQPLTSNPINAASLHVTDDPISASPALATEVVIVEVVADTAVVNQPDDATKTSAIIADDPSQVIA
ncbi:hypothetical protein GUJ93_ZPchr0006g41255 [Zizania palustris]|uniref:Uncharacterized protein n=1 Tax=Zizania palustris TaxID=103762 RepID=A0A8J5VXL0_ZIZPA|nr:hypothetical protein GUJ93_ZPchr0006g41255 [Zizania palustris]